MTWGGQVNVPQLRFSEPAEIDSDRIEALIDDYGSDGAERFVGRALEELAVRLNKTERAWRRGDTVRLCHGSRELADVADRIGLSGLARAATAASRIAMSGDAAAIGATVGRMLRLGEASLMTAWGLRGQSL